MEGQDERAISTYQCQGAESGVVGIWHAVDEGVQSVPTFDVVIDT